MNGRRVAGRRGSRATTIQRRISCSGVLETHIHGSGISGPATTFTRRRPLRSTSPPADQRALPVHAERILGLGRSVAAPSGGLRRGGRTIKGLVNFARSGYLYFLERTDGAIKFVEGMPYVKQNVFKGLDPHTGRPDIDPATQTRHRKDGRVLSVLAWR